MLSRWDSEKFIVAIHLLKNYEDAVPGSHRSEEVTRVQEFDTYDKAHAWTKGHSPDGDFYCWQVHCPRWWMEVKWAEDKAERERRIAESNDPASSSYCPF